jgi:hypothetical protein
MDSVKRRPARTVKGGLRPSPSAIETLDGAAGTAKPASMRTTGELKTISTVAVRQGDATPV